MWVPGCWRRKTGWSRPGRSRRWPWAATNAPDASRRRVERCRRRRRPDQRQQGDEQTDKIGGCHQKRCQSWETTSVQQIFGSCCCHGYIVWVIRCCSNGSTSQGTLTIILKGEVSVRLTSLSLLVWNQLFQENIGIFFHFQNNLILTSKDEEVSCTDTSPFFKVESSLH